MRGIVFDVDDTLYLESDYVRSGFVAASEYLRKEHGVTGFADIAWQLFSDGVRGQTFNLALERLGIAATDGLIDQLVGMYRQHEPDIQLLPDSDVAVRHLAEHGVPIGVLTDGPADSQWAKIIALGLDGLADAIVVTADLGPGMSKPREDGFRRIEQMLGLSGAALTYVADNPAKDFLAPDALGWRTIRIRRHGGLHAHVSSSHEVQLESDVIELDRLLG